MVFMGPRPHLSLCACKTTRLTSELLVSMGPSLHLWFLHAKLRLYDQNYKSLWFPGLICCFFAFTTASLWPELIVSMGSRPHLSLCACKTTRLAPELQVSMGPRPHLWFFAFETAPLAQEFQVSIMPSPHLRFFQAKPRLFDQKY